MGLEWEPALGEQQGGAEAQEMRALKGHRRGARRFWKAALCKTMCSSPGEVCRAGSSPLGRTALMGATDSFRLHALGLPRSVLLQLSLGSLTYLEGPGRNQILILNCKKRLRKRNLNK